MWLTYLRGTIESFTAEGKSCVVGRRPGMAGDWTMSGSDWSWC